MATNEQEQNRSEQATPFKLRQARDRGMVPRSAEVNSALLTLAFVGLLYVMGQRTLTQQFRLDAFLFSHAHTFGFSESVANAWLTAVLTNTIQLLLPLFLALVGVAVVVGFVQAGPVFSFEPLQPDWDRVNPVSGMRRLISGRVVFETIKTVLKLGIFGYAIYAILGSLMPLVFGLAQQDPHALGRVGLSVIVSLIFKLALILLAFAAIDLIYARRDYANKMMMSRREMKEEMKRREGDPKIKARIRELQREMRKRSNALKRVPDADVLITNPQHLAIALRYAREEMRAPKVIAKGAGDLALSMRILARKHSIPIVENRKLARALFLNAGLDQPIPDNEYRAVARVLAKVYGQREARRTKLRSIEVST
jgi:flagellar biosynthetic protein FlhB